MKRKISILSLLSTVLFVQCYTDIDGSQFVGNQRSVLYLTSLLTSDQFPEVQVASAEVAYSGIEPRILTDEDVVVKLQNGEVVQILEFDESKQSFGKKGMLIESGTNYSIQVESSQIDGFPQVSGSSLIPEKVNFDNLELLDNLSYALEADIFQYIYNVELQLPAEKKGKYYFIEPVSRLIIKEGDIREYKDEFDTYTVNGVLQSSPALRLANNSHGVLINFSEDPELQSLNLNISLDHRFNRNNQEHKHIYFYLHNISKEYYLFLKNGGEVNTQKDVFTEPIIEYTNVIDGRGIVGGASITLDSMLIQ